MELFITVIGLVAAAKFGKWWLSQDATPSQTHTTRLKYTAHVSSCTCVQCFKKSL